MPQLDIRQSVCSALAEDVGTGDITAALIAEGHEVKAQVITKQACSLCGCAWFNEVFRQLSATIKICWLVKDGDKLYPGQQLCQLLGDGRSILTGERTGLNFLQTLSATATYTAHLISLLQGTQTRLLDTRKTLPGLRKAQKYAVVCGGGSNHRMGLYDAFLIKENHIYAKGSIKGAIKAARQYKPQCSVEIEVENLDQLQQALSAGADIILLDNFSLNMLKQAVILNNGQAKLEASGNISEQNLRAVALTGVDYISVGALTKHIQAVDLSMRIL